jgi:hypothetical protein
MDRPPCIDGDSAMKRLALLLPLALLAPLAASSGQPAGDGASDRAAALARALDSVQAPNLSADVHFFASDELGGRDTPSEGLRVAARFVRARLQRLGFQPGARNGYFHEYELEAPQLHGERTWLEIESGGATRKLAFARDYYFSGRGRDIADATTRGPVVFGGEGDALDGLDLTDSWLLVWDNGQRTGRIRNAAEDTAAIGLIVIPGPKYDGKPFAERYAAGAESALKSGGRLRPVLGRRPASGRDLFPVIYVGAEAAAGLVPEGAQAGDKLSAVVSDVRARGGENGGRVAVENVCGFWPGSDPLLKNEVIILSAHYDHVGIDDSGDVYNGADDNASGSCGLLAVAEALKAYGPLRRSVLLLWVSGEEKGLWGSYAWTQDPWLPDGAKPICDINVDMIGRNAPDKLLLTPTADHKSFNGLARLAIRLSPEEGFPVLGSADEYWSRSDHMNFNVQLKLPVAFLFSDVHEDYHQVSDTADKIDYDKLRRVVRLVVRMLDELQADELDL